MEIWHFCRSPVAHGVERGGVSSVVAQLSRETASNGIPTHVVCSDQDLNAKTGTVGEVVVNDKLTVYTIRQHRNKLAGPFRDLISEIERVPPNAVAHVHGCFSSFAELAMYMLNRHSIRFIFSPHGKLSPGMISNRGVSKRLMWNCLTRHLAGCAEFAGLFAEEEGQLFDRLGLKIPHVVIPNGYRKPDGGICREVPVISGKYILFLGFLDPRKQPAVLIESFALSSARLTHRLVLVGPDGYGHRKELEAKAASLGLGSQILFYGPSYGAEKWNILANATCLCLPSKAEGMPLVLVEALGALTPSIFSRASNASDIAREGAGIEIRSEEISMWSKAIDELTSSADMRDRMKSNAFRIRANFEWSTIARRWIEVYKSVGIN